MDIRPAPGVLLIKVKSTEIDPEETSLENEAANAVVLGEVIASGDDDILKGANVLIPLGAGVGMCIDAVPYLFVDAFDVLGFVATPIDDDFDKIVKAWED